MGMGDPQKLVIWRLPNEYFLPPETSWELPARWMGSEEAVVAAQSWWGCIGLREPLCLHGAKHCQEGPGRLAEAGCEACQSCVRAALAGGRALDDRNSLCSTWQLCLGSSGLSHCLGREANTNAEGGVWRGPDKQPLGELGEVDTVLVDEPGSGRL